MPQLRTTQAVLDETLSALLLANENLQELSRRLNVADPIPKHAGETTGKTFSGYARDVRDLRALTLNTFLLAHSWATESAKEAV